MTITITDPAQLVYPYTFPKDDRFALFLNGLLLNEGDEFDFGPGPGQITLAVAPKVGDRLEFRRL